MSLRDEIEQIIRVDTVAGAPAGIEAMASEEGLVHLTKEQLLDVLVAKSNALENAILRLADAIDETR